MQLLVTGTGNPAAPIPRPTPQRMAGQVGERSGTFVPAKGHVALNPGPDALVDAVAASPVMPPNALPDTEKS